VKTLLIKLETYNYWVIKPLIWKYLEEPIKYNNWYFWKQLFS